MKNLLIYILRKFRLIKFADKIRFYICLIKTNKLRKRFSKEYPTVQLPPAYFIYETFNLNYFSFYLNSIETAKWLVSYFQKHAVIDGVKILDWGCGPGRVIRHLPALIPNSCE